MTSDEQVPELGALRRRVRLVMLIDAAERSGLAPIALSRLHMFAYLSDVLAPVWELTPMEGKLLKQKHGPYYPALQYDLDRLVGIGVVEMLEVGYALDRAKRWRLQGTYKLNRTMAEPIVSAIESYDAHDQTLSFVRELGFALSSLSDHDIDNAMTEDATYSDVLVDDGNVIDFAEYRDVNYTARSAEYFERYLPSGSDTTAGEKLHLYMRHLRARIHGAR